MENKTRILIVGAGIGGLSIAKLLRKEGFNPTIIEKKKDWKTMGYVLGIWSNGLHVLDELGVADEIRKKGANVPGFVLRNGEGNLIWETKFGSLGKKRGELVEIEREILHKSLRAANKETDIKRGITIKNLHNQENNVRVEFNDGKINDFDIVVGADGLNSQIRSIIQPEVKKDYSGHTFFMFWLPPKIKSSPNVEHYWGNGKFFGIFPTKNDRHVCGYFSIPAKPHSVPIESSGAFIKNHFSDMGGVVPRVLKHLPKKAARIYHTDDNEIHDRQWYNGRIVLMGDSVHALSAIPAMGACMALEDAHVLAEEITKSENHKEAFYNYQERRVKRINWIASKSKQMHFLLSLKSPWYGLRNAFMKNMFGPFYFKETKHFLEEKI